MAIYFQPGGQSRSGSLGSSIGEGLGRTLQMLTQNKMLQQQQQQKQQFEMDKLMQMQQMQEEQRERRGFDIAQGLSSMGIPREVSENIARMPEGQQNMFLKQFFGSQASMPGQLGAPGPAEQPGSRLGEMLGMQQETEEGAPGQPPQQFEEEQETITEEQRQELPGKLADFQKISEPGEDYTEIRKRIQDSVNQLSADEKKSLRTEIQRATKEAARFAERKAAKAAIPEGASREAKPGYRIQAKPTRRKTFQELLATPRPSGEDRKRAEDMAIKREGISAAKQRSIDASTKDYYSKTLAAGKDAQANDMRLARMKELNQSGDLSSPAWASALETVSKGVFGLGLNLKFLQTADSQEFDKLSKDFLKNAKSIFGSRVTEGEIKMFLQTIPTLVQTKEARNRVIRNMKMLNEGAKLRKKAMVDVIEMNGGERPSNMEIIIEKKVGPKLDKIAEAFKFGGTKKKKTKPSQEKGLLSRILAPLPLENKGFYY